MNVSRALEVVPHDAHVSASCRTNYYGGAWVIWADLPAVPELELEATRRPLTQFAEPFSAARWVNSWYAEVSKLKGS